MSPRSERKQALGQRSTEKKHATLMISKPELSIWSRDSGQRISWYDSCQLNIKCMSNIKDICCNPRLHDLVLAGWPPCCATSFIVVVGRTRPWSTRVSISMHTRGSFFYNYGAPLGSPSGCRSSATKYHDTFIEWFWFRKLYNKVNMPL